MTARARAVTAKTDSRHGIANDDLAARVRDHGPRRVGSPASPPPPTPPTPATVDDTVRKDLVLAADCFDCGGRLRPVTPGHVHKGGLHLRVDVQCQPPGCGRRWTFDIAATGHPRGRR